MEKHIPHKTRDSKVCSTYFVIFYIVRVQWQFGRNIAGDTARIDTHGNLEGSAGEDNQGYRFSIQRGKFAFSFLIFIAAFHVWDYNLWFLLLSMAFVY